jgi:quercetin dioxygenase-like cupin family protein
MMLRRFNHEEHIRNMASAPAVDMFDDLGRVLSGIVGVGGATGLMAGGMPLGVDQIVMSAGSAFPLHVHEGDHLLYVLEGVGGLHVDGVDYVLREGDSIYVPADYPHGVRGPDSGPPVRILAFGVPHHPIDSTTRMRLVSPEDSHTTSGAPR